MNSKFTEVCTQGSNRQWVSFGSGNGLMLNRRHAITWLWLTHCESPHTDTPTYTSLTKVCDHLSPTGPWFNIRTTSYQYRKSHCGDKMVIRSSYLHNGISYTGKMSSLYWISPLVSSCTHSHFLITLFLGLFTQLLVVLLHEAADLSVGCLAGVVLLSPHVGAAGVVTFPVTIEWAHNLAQQ